ncbi:MAG: sulfatase [Planctomycetota bacterium]
MPSERPAAPYVRRPNLVFILADQLGYTRCGYAGDEKARTPNIDRFAAEGVNFRQAVASSPVCAAFRASLFTGKYTTSTGMVINELRLGTDHECLGHVLTRGGCRTGYVGKWHLYANEMGNHLDPKNSFVPPGPDRLGFDGYWAAYNFHHNYYGAYYHTDSPEKISYGEGAYEPDAQTDLAIDFIRGAADADDPFALFVSYGTPHDPWSPENVPPEYLEMFRGVEFPHPPNYEPENDPHADGWGQLSALAREHMPNWRRVYHAMTANVDRNFGRLLDEIGAAGLAGATIVVFSSDHGEMFGAHGRRAKNIFYEEAARIPLLVRFPGRIPAGNVSDACLSTPDIMPTLLSLMGLPVPRDAEGMDLSHCALGTDGPEPEAAFLQNTGACADWIDGHEWRAMRDKRYTCAVYRVDGSELLFDNAADPYQMTNLAADPAHKAALARFRAMLAAKMSSLNDTFEKCTWYRDHWTEDRIILRAAKG